MPGRLRPVVRKNKKELSNSKNRSKDQSESESENENNLSVQDLMKEQENVNSFQNTKQNIEKEVHSVFNNFIKDIINFDEGAAESNSQIQDELQPEKQKFQSINVFLVDQIVVLIQNAKQIGQNSNIQKPNKNEEKKKSVSRGKNKKKEAVQNEEEEYEEGSYPFKIVEDIFLQFVQRVLTTDCKNAKYKHIMQGLQKIFERLAKKKIVSNQNQNGHKILTQTIKQLADIYLLTNTGPILKLRSSYILTQIFLETKQSFRLNSLQILQSVKECAIDMMLQQQKQNIQQYGIQIALLLYKENEIHNNDIFFNCMHKTIMISKFKECRKKILKQIKVPSLIDKNPESLNEESQQIQKAQKNVLLSLIVPRLIDSDYEVRVSAYQKMSQCKFRIEDVQGKKGRMVIIKEGMTDQIADLKQQFGLQQKSLSAKDCCLNFLKESILQKTKFQISEQTYSQLFKKLNDQKQQDEKFKMKKKSIDVNEKKKDSESEDEIIADQNNLEVQINCYDFCSLYRNIDVQLTFISEYFVQLPFLIINTVFEAVFVQFQKDFEYYLEIEKDSSKDKRSSFQKMIDEQMINMLDQPYDLLILYYAQILLKKIIRSSEYVNEENESSDNQLPKTQDIAFEIFEALNAFGRDLDGKNKNNEIIEFEELFFLRNFFEYSKWTWNERSDLFKEKYNQIIPTFEEYQHVFNFLLKNGSQQIKDLDLSEQDYKQNTNRLFLSEWVKFSLQINIEDETTRSQVTSLLLNFISDITYSFDDYQYLLNGNKQYLDLNGNVQNIESELKSNQQSDQQMFDPDDSEARENERQEVDDIYEEIESHINLFYNLQVNKKQTYEYLKPFSFEMLVRDSDDLCQVAAMIIKRLMSSEEGGQQSQYTTSGTQFSREMLQIISTVREPLEIPKTTNNMQTQIVYVEKDDDFEAQSMDQQEDFGFNIKILKQKYKSKFEQKLAIIEQYNDSEEDDQKDLNIDIKTVLLKARLYHRVQDEINLKEKLILKRALNLCLILLKQCRVNINDKNLIDICQTLIQPALKATEDKEFQLLAIESIGLISLLDQKLFGNYSMIFQAILEDSLEQNCLPEDSLHETIIALKSSIDGLIVHGTNNKTDQLQNLILQSFMYSSDKRLRQISIEGICKMLFSIKISKEIQHKNGLELTHSKKRPETFIDDKSITSDESIMHRPIEEIQPPNNDGVVVIISHLIIQLFDKKFLCQQQTKSSIINQALNMFFRHFILYSPQKCQIMLQALVRVAFTSIYSKYIEGEDEEPQVQVPLKKKAAKKGKAGKKKPVVKSRVVRKDDYQDESSVEENSDGSEFMLAPKIEIKQCNLSDVCRNLDLNYITNIFMIFLSKNYINQNAPKEFHIKNSLVAEYVINICNLNNFKFKKVDIVKKIIVNLIDSLSIDEIYNSNESEKSIQILKILRYQLVKSSKKLIQGFPKLKKAIQEITQKIQEIESLKIKSFSIDELSMIDKDDENEERAGPVIEQDEKNLEELNAEEKELLKQMLIPYDVLEEFYETMKDHQIETKNPNFNSEEQYDDMILITASMMGLQDLDLDEQQQIDFYNYQQSEQKNYRQQDGNSSNRVVNSNSYSENSQRMRLRGIQSANHQFQKKMGQLNDLEQIKENEENSEQSNKQNSSSKNRKVRFFDDVASQIQNKKQFDLIKEESEEEQISENSIED